MLPSALDWVDPTGEVPPPGRLLHKDIRDLSSLSWNECRAGPIVFSSVPLWEKFQYQSANLESALYVR